MSVSARNSILMPSVTLVPSMLYPTAPSIVLKTSFVKSSTKSTSSLAKVPNLFNFNPASNSIIGLFALAS